ncbi:MAG: nucleotidyltransferase family protein [Chthoniobacterales bacterium]|nr:nucleotidyltransferase family protein [Chthoniobacterales bacterium]
MKIAALVLAAGGSSRLGQPKQLVSFQGQTLIRHIVKTAASAGCAPVVVVVGRDQQRIAAELADLPVTILPNEKWEHGLGTSIRAGVAALPEVDAVIILACDQPHVDETLLHRLMAEQHRTQRPMVGSSYAQTVGIPALFSSACFAKLLSLGDEEGAKSLLLSRPNETSTVAFAAGEIDLDTPNDLQRIAR